MDGWASVPNQTIDPDAGNAPPVCQYSAALASLVVSSVWTCSPSVRNVTWPAGRVSDRGAIRSASRIVTTVAALASWAAPTPHRSATESASSVRMVFDIARHGLRASFRARTHQNEGRDPRSASRPVSAVNSPRPSVPSVDPVSTARMKFVISRDAPANRACAMMAAYAIADGAHRVRQGRRDARRRARLPPRLGPRRGVRSDAGGRRRVRGPLRRRGVHRRRDDGARGRRPGGLGVHATPRRTRTRSRPRPRTAPTSSSRSRSRPRSPTATGRSPRARRPASSSASSASAGSTRRSCA